MLNLFHLGCPTACLFFGTLMRCTEGLYKNHRVVGWGGQYATRPAYVSTVLSEGRHTVVCRCKHSTSGILTTASDMSAMDHATFPLRVTARDHGTPARSSHVDVIVVVDASIPYTVDRHRRPADDQRAGSEEAGLLDANLPFVLVALGLCAAFVVILIVLMACAATACAASRRRRTTRNHRQVRATHIHNHTPR